MITASEAAKISTTVQKNIEEKEFPQWTEIVNEEIRKAAESGEFSTEIWLTYPTSVGRPPSYAAKSMFYRMRDLLQELGYFINSNSHYVDDEFHEYAWFKVKWKNTA